MFEKLHNKLMSLTWRRGRGTLNKIVLGKTSHHVSDGFVPYNNNKKFKLMLATYPILVEYQLGHTHEYWVP